MWPMSCYIFSGDIGCVWLPKLTSDNLWLSALFGSYLHKDVKMCINLIIDTVKEMMYNKLKSYTVGLSVTNGKGV